MRELALLAALALAASGADLKPVDEASYPKLVAGAKGKVLLVNFWATYCVPCRKEMPQLVALEAKLRGQGFQLASISADEPEQTAAAAAFIDKAKVPAPAYIRKAKDDDRFVHAIDPKWEGALPASFLYDKNGRRVRSFFGEVNTAELEEAVKKLL